MNIYLESGYLDFNRIFYQIPATFIFIYGPRGVGKTYGALEKVYQDRHKFIYMRRTQTELDLVVNPQYMPFKVLNEDHGWNIGLKMMTKYNGAFYEQIENTDGTWSCAGEPIGYSMALSTVRNLRGFDASDVEYLIYDEFIPESHARPIKDECDAFLNAYETINRNRELKGKPPVKVICLANSNRLANPIFIDLALVNSAQRMKVQKQNYLLIRDRGIALMDTFDSPISEQKQETALYKVANKNSRFYEMAINNRFDDLDGSSSATRNLDEYRPVLKVGELVLYKHKSRRETYISMHKRGSMPEFSNSEKDMEKVRRTYPWIWPSYINNRIVFEDYMCEALFNQYWH